MQAIFTDRAPPFSTRSYKAAEEAERKARKDAEKAKAMEIIESQQTTQDYDPGRVCSMGRTVQQHHERRRRGYVPEMVTVEQLEWARKVLSDS